MQNKENSNPKKQGILYTISTGKNNGAYLPKDISSQNHKSLKLLTKQAQESHKSYADSLKLVQRQEKESKSHVSLVEVGSFCEDYGFGLRYVGNLRVLLGECGAMNKQLRGELEKLKDKITLQNSQLHEAAMPALKTLKQKIKQSKEEQSANYSKMHRELQKIEQCFGLVASGIRECERRFELSQNEYKGHLQNDE